jgi:predicted Zn finger-like uncharacterized protein
MRLICPNCGAQYEVADDVIQDSGRDVQCSNCGHTWFESPGASEAAEMPPVPDTAPDPEPEVEPDSEPQAADPDPTPEPTPEPQPRGIDPDVADILRQEAEFEQAARQAEADPIETQPKMDLSHDPEPEIPEAEIDDIEEDHRSREARDRLARLRVEPEAAAAATGAAMAAASTAPRRELLPDIEEINSTLRPDAAAASAPDEEAAVETRNGFRRGFILVVILALNALAVYVFAPQISAAVPAAEPALANYMTWVDGLRLWLDGQVQSLISGASDA